MHVNRCLHTCIRNKNLHMYVYIYVCAHVYVYVYVCTYVYVYVCMDIYISCQHYSVLAEARPRCNSLTGRSAIQGARKTGLACCLVQLTD